MLETGVPTLRIWTISNPLRSVRNGMTMIEIARVAVEAATTNPLPHHSVRFRLAVAVVATTTLVEAAAAATRITRAVETTTESEQQLK